MEDENQEKYLEDARKVVKEQAYYMKKAIDSANLRDALRYASFMISELKTSLLSPRNYYALFVQVFDELRVLEAAFKEEHRRGRRMSDLYESVQYAGNILPRLYLLVTVGSVYIETHEVQAKDILNDLLEMVKAVQHPLRGLFLRYYYLKMVKDKLPDKDSEYSDGGSVQDVLNVILGNLAEMNKLWIRMQNVAAKDKAKREKERVDLRVLVGENLVRLSNLLGVNLETYSTEVLPKLLETISSSKDHISQQYLMECIIQAFPDEYHLHNLSVLLQTTTQLLPQVDIKAIFIRLMDRLADFASNLEQPIESLAKDIDIFELFKTNIDKIIQEQAQTMEIRKFLELQVAFLNFTLQFHERRTENVNSILQLCCNLLEKQGTPSFDEESLKSIVKLLTLPLETMSITILSMGEYPNLMRYLPFNKRKEVSYKICQAVVHTRRPLNSLELTNQLITFITPLLKEDPNGSPSEPYEFEEEQHLVSRLVHLVQNESVDVVYAILSEFKARFLEGDLKRMKYTLPPLIHAYTRLARQVRSVLDGGNDENGEEVQKPQTVDFNGIFRTIKELIDKLAPNHPETAIRLYLHELVCINECDRNREFDEFSYELAELALTLYQEELVDASAKNTAIYLIIGTLQRLVCLSEENYDTLITNATQYSAKLLKKKEQCVTVLQCSHLFMNNNYKNETRAFECFKKCLKIADTSVNQSIKNLGLYTAILNKFLYFLNLGVKSLQINDVQSCISLIKGKMNVLVETGDQEVIKEIQSYLANTFAYIEAKKKLGAPNFDQLITEQIDRH